MTRAFDTRSAAQDARTSKRQSDVFRSEPIPASQLHHDFSTPLIQRKAGCACGGGCPNCAEEEPAQAIQAKLTVSTPGDPYEQEADRVSDQIMRMPDTLIQRQCESCSNTSRSEHSLSIQRYSNTKTGPGAAPAEFTNHLGPGAPLDSATRSYFEPRFGHDFSNVRIHHGAQAAAAAARVEARAFTLGHDVVFGAGEHNPGTEKGRRLLAHELTHVVQQSGSGALQRNQATALQRQAQSGGATTVTVQSTGNCSLSNGAELGAAGRLAQQWLRAAIEALHHFEALPISRSSESTRTALQFHFHTTNPFHAALVRTRLAQVRDGLDSSQATPSDCAAARDPGCGSATVAYHQNGRINWCPFFFGRDPNSQARTVIHEYTHAEARRLPLAAGYAELSDHTPRRIKDRAYLDRRYYLDLSPEEAMDNADSYANLTADLGTGTPLTQSPSERAEDTMTGCAPGAQETIRQSLSMAARWNDEAIDMLSIDATLPSLFGMVSGAITVHFGSSPPTRASLSAIYEAATSSIILGMALECDGARGNCQSPSTRLWRSGMGGTIHVCPGWIAESDALERHRMLYQSVLSNVARLPGNPWRYVDLARDLEARSDLDRPIPALPTDPFPQSSEPGTAIG